LPPKRKKRKRRGLVDTSVLVAGISGFRKPYVRGRNPSADVLYRWAENGDFVWLVTEEIESREPRIYLDAFANCRQRLAVAGSARLFFLAGTNAGLN
jgi:hypothetical protein